MISARKRREGLIKAEKTLTKLSLSFLKNLSTQRQRGKYFNDSELSKIDDHYKALNSPQSIRTAICQYGQESLPLQQRISHAFKQEKEKGKAPNPFGHTAIKYNTAYRIFIKISRAIEKVNHFRESLGKPPLSGSMSSIISQQFSQHLNKNPARDEISQDLKTAIEKRIIKNKWSWFSPKKKSLSKSENELLESLDYDKLADIAINESHRDICDEMVNRGEIVYVGHGPWRHIKLGTKASPQFRQAFSKKITAQIQKNLKKKDQHLFNNHDFDLAQLEWAAKRSNNNEQSKRVMEQLDKYGLYNDKKSFMNKQLEDAINTLSANVAFSPYYLSVANKMGWMSGGFKYNSNPPCPPRFKKTLNNTIKRVIANIGIDRELNQNEEQEIISLFDNLRSSGILNLSAGFIHVRKIDRAILSKISSAIKLLTTKLLNNNAGKEGEFDKKFYLMAKRIGLINTKGEISKLAPYQTKVCYERAIQELFTKGNLTENLAKAKELGWLDEKYNPTPSSPKMFQEKMVDLKNDIAKSIVQLQSGDGLGDFSISNHTTSYMKSELRSGSLRYIELAQNQNWIASKDGQVVLTQAGKNAGLTVNKINTNKIHNHLRTNQSQEYLYNIHAGLMSIAFNTLDGKDKSNNIIFSYCSNILEKIMAENAAMKHKVNKIVFSQNENRYESYILAERIRAIHNGIKRKKIHIDPNSGKITFDKGMMKKEIFKLAKERIHMIERKTRMLYDAIKSGKIKIDQGTGKIDFDKKLLEKREYSEIHNEIQQGKIQINHETNAINFTENCSEQEAASMINKKIRPLEEKIKAIQLALKNNKIKIDRRTGEPIFDRELLKQKEFKEIYNEIRQGKISVHPNSHEIKFDNDWLEQNSQPALTKEIYDELSETVSNEIVSVIQQSEEKLKFNDCPDKSLLDEYSDSQAKNDDDIDYNQSHLQSNSYSSGNHALIINSPPFNSSNNKIITLNHGKETNDDDYLDYVRGLI